MPFRDFQYAFVNTLPLVEQKLAYERYVVPESRGVPRESLTSTAKIDLSKPHAPLLMIAGEKDHIVPAALNQTNYIKIQGISITDRFQCIPRAGAFLDLAAGLAGNRGLYPGMVETHLIHKMMCGLILFVA
jgi:pimeloyl-ACP methyl ester carboxylesterase